MEISWGIIGLLIFLFFWAGSGHLIWKTVRFFFVHQSELPELSRKPKVTAPDPESDLKSAQRLLEYSVFREWIEPSQRQMLVDLLAKLKDRLGTPIATSPTNVALKTKGIQAARANRDGSEIESEWKSFSKPSLPAAPVTKPEPARVHVHALVSNKDNVAKCFDYDVYWKQMLPNVL